MWREALTAPLRALADACVRQPLSVPVPADDAAFAARKGTLRLAMRTARRAVLLRLSGQRRHLKTYLAPAAHRLLWIHEGMPQIGDALMDLAPRSLLVEQGFILDLFAAPHIASLFEGDAYFARVLCAPDAVRADDYDAVIVLSHDRKALRLKRARLAALPWVSLHGWYGGPDFHRARFATRRLADLLGLTPAAADFARHSAQKLLLPADLADPVDGAAHDRIALALGGVWPARTYHRWAELVSLMSMRGQRRFVLVGGANGRELADALIARFGAELDLQDGVGRASLREAQALFARAAVVVVADGGLMHLALTTSTPVVALFNSAIRPEWRLPTVLNGIALQSAGAAVDDIAAESIANAVERLRAATPR